MSRAHHTSVFSSSAAPLWAVFIGQTVLGVAALLLLDDWQPQSPAGWAGLLVFGWFAGSAMVLIAAGLYVTLRALKLPALRWFR